MSIRNRFACLFTAVGSLLGTTVIRAETEIAPVIPGFDRFHSNSADAAGGRLLLGELQCTACHRAEGVGSDELLYRQAPVLDDIGRRVHADWLQKFIANPHQVKPGTPMPNLFAGLSETDKREQVEALTHYLIGNRQPPVVRTNRKSISQGEELYHRIGCIACHDSPRNETKLAHSVPLGTLGEKYTVPSLSVFLRNPHRFRPSGRMPNFNLNDEQSRAIAGYLLKDVAFAPLEPNLRYQVFHGQWENLPDLSTLRPVSTGIIGGLDLSAAGRENNFAIRFDGFFTILREGTYRFHLGSDDASKLYIDEELIVNNDGVHPHTVKAGDATLTAGVHRIRVDYAQVGGEWTLELEYEGPETARQNVNSALSLTTAGPKPQRSSQDEEVFVFDAEKARKGRDLFATIGCASCHELKERRRTIVSRLEAPPLQKLILTGGCLASSETPTDRVPQFDLNQSQRTAISAALRSGISKSLSNEERIHQTLAAFNCYACHQRGELGGVETERNAFFEGAIPEMGDEGRIPPLLTGVGDKLNSNWLSQLLDKGADDRPYMHTQMPEFGRRHVGHLVKLFEAEDRKTEANFPELDLPNHRVKAIGRHMAGDQGLSCIKCHNFGSHRATGVQSLDLTTMTKRLRQEWFHRYMVNPQEYRPGTRMPTAWPGGRSILPQVLDDDTDQQLVALWRYLADSSQAGVPSGLTRNAILLSPTDRPVIYRNFIEGLSPRGIAVGYPEKANLAFDAQTFSLALIWHGAFIDASKHWIGRGPGFQRPAGDHLLSLVRGVPIANLESANSPWPAESPKELEYQFRGYRLDEYGRPIFGYSIGEIRVTDFPLPVAGDQEPSLRRTLTIRGRFSGGTLYFRAAAGQSIERLKNDRYLIDGSLEMRFENPGNSVAPIVRSSRGKQELLVPLAFDNNGSATIIQELSW